MGHGEIDLQQGAITDLSRIEGHFDGLRMAGITLADPLISSRVGCPASVTGDGLLHAFDMLEHPLDAPEAAAGKDHGFATGLGRFIEGRRWNEHGLFSGAERKCRALTDDASGGQPQQGATPGEQGFHEADSWVNVRAINRR
ncbi:hypothetical protein D3C87_1795450 [compost metagenome]